VSDNTKMMLEFLSEPFPPNAVEKRQGAHGRMLDYIATETVIRRLNKVAMQWDFRITDKHIQEGLLVIWGELTIPGLGTRSGTGVQQLQGGEDMWKGAASDCLKKCATLFGVGIELYGPDLEAGEMPEQPNLPARDRTTSQNTIPQQTQAYIPPAESNGTSQLATPRQINFVRAIAKEQGLSDEELADELDNLYSKSLSELDRRDASAFIERLQSRRNVTELVS
jgi:hypothetical protein